jgi:hypothetical protein
MTDVLARLSSYNIFNYLLPGIVFAITSNKLFGLSFAQGEIVVDLFIYYFIGLVISRVGSMIIEPVLARTGLVKRIEYEEFVAASRRDSKLELLSEANNTYRSLAAMILVLGLLRAYSIAENWVLWLREWRMGFLLGGSFVLFVLAYRKQSKYLVNRVRANQVRTLTP